VDLHYGMKMRYRQPFHEKLENTVVRGSSDDAGGVGARGGSRARAWVRVCARAQACGRVRVHVRGRARGGGMSACCAQVAHMTRSHALNMPSEALRLDLSAF
jgi:hypothetical protein